MIALGWVFAIVSSIIFWGAALEVLVRSLWHSGLNIKLWKVSPYTPSYTAVHSPLPLHKGDGLKVVLFAVGLRLVMILVAFLMLWHSSGAVPTFAQLMQAGTGWDDYRMMAEYGYFYHEDGQNLLLVFFPLYIYLTRFLGFAIRNFQLAAYIISFVSYVFAAYYLYRLVRLDFSKSVAKWAVVFISIAPPAFYFGTPMSESLLLLTSVITLYYIRVHKWWLAGVAGALAMATRMVGAVLVIVAFVEFFTHFKVFALIKKSKWGEVWGHFRTKGAWIFLMFAGGAVYLFLNWWVSGNPFMFMYYQRVHWGNSTQYFGQTLLLQFRVINGDWMTPEMIRWTFVPNILAFTFAIITIAYATKKRINVGYVIYALGYVFISYSPSWLLSGSRYITACIPLFIFLACMTEKRPVFRLTVAFIFIAGLLPMRYVLLTGGMVF